MPPAHTNGVVEGLDDCNRALPAAPAPVFPICGAPANGRIAATLLFSVSEIAIAELSFSAAGLVSNSQRVNCGAVAWLALSARIILRICPPPPLAAAQFVNVRTTGAVVLLDTTSFGVYAVVSAGLV